jgi:hypothetical protein
VGGDLKSLKNTHNPHAQNVPKTKVEGIKPVEITRNQKQGFRSRRGRPSSCHKEENIKFERKFARVPMLLIREIKEDAVVDSISPQNNLSTVGVEPRTVRLTALLLLAGSKVGASLRP